MPRVIIVPKSELSEKELREIAPRIAAAESPPEVSPRCFWDLESYEPRYYAVLEATSRDFMGTVYCRIEPPTAFDIAYWLEASQRGKGYWRDLADAVADYLIEQGVTALDLISFRGSHEGASRRIADRIAARLRAL